MAKGSLSDQLYAFADSLRDAGLEGFDAPRCEMKFATDLYALSKAGEEAIRRKVHDFQVLTSTRSAMHVTLVTPYGLRQNAHAGTFQSVVTADDLFA